jgi:glycosyltransferase involved in cell wall biosynthesis
MFMRIAIVHYHLRPGGVTRVIQHSLSALAESARKTSSKDDIQIIVLAGELPSPSMPITSYAVIEALSYNPSPNLSPKPIIAQLKVTAKQALGEIPDVWHFHNHALGKNLIIPEIVHHLAQEGQRLLLQLHDFAEDGRPDNYKFLRDHLGHGDPLRLGAHLYPQGEHIHYALINQRDLKFLRLSGVKESQLHYLPDAVSMESNEELEPSKKDRSDKGFFLYPTRAIRRKNLGEFLLWSAMAEEGDHFAVTRAPKNPLAQPVYNDWVGFAQSLELPVKFAVSEKWQGDFPSLLRSANVLATTSVTEGFGLAFLEPWLVNRPLVGRKLPEITDEFERMGVDLSTLYNQILIPIEWVGLDRFHQAVQQALKQVYESYGWTARDDDVERAVETAITGEYIDFGRLDEDLQKTVIERIVRSPSLKAEIVPPKLELADDQTNTIQQNRKIVKEQFNLQKYGKRLLQIYQTVAESDVGPIHEIHADVLLDKFLAPERFWLLRT